MSMQKKQLPIGYYLKLADTCLTRGIDEIQSQYGLTRIEWQVINTIMEQQAILESELIELFKPIADFEAIRLILKTFVDKKYVEQYKNILKLTISGQDLYQSCLVAQQDFRKKAFAHISENEYQTTLSTLQKLIANIS